MMNISKIMQYKFKETTLLISWPLFTSILYESILIVGILIWLLALSNSSASLLDLLITRKEVIITIIVRIVLVINGPVFVFAFIFFVIVPKYKNLALVNNEPQLSLTQFRHSKELREELDMWLHLQLFGLETLFLMFLMYGLAQGERGESLRLYLMSPLGFTLAFLGVNVGVILTYIFILVFRLMFFTDSK